MQPPMLANGKVTVLGTQLEEFMNFKEGYSISSQIELSLRREAKSNLSIPKPVKTKIKWLLTLRERYMGIERGNKCIE